MVLQVAKSAAGAQVKSLWPMLHVVCETMHGRHRQAGAVKEPVSVFLSVYLHGRSPTRAHGCVGITANGLAPRKACLACGAGPAERSPHHAPAAPSSAAAAPSLRPASMLRTCCMRAAE